MSDTYLPFEYTRHKKIITLQLYGLDLWQKIMHNSYHSFSEISISPPIFVLYGASNRFSLQIQLYHSSFWPL